MSEKKKGVFSKLFQPKNGCGCGVSIVEETKPTDKKESATNKKKQIS